jgi:hypothetical protein
MTINKQLLPFEDSWVIIYNPGSISITLVLTVLPLDDHNMDV